MNEARPIATDANAIALSWQPPKGLYSLSVVNFVLRILTLGIYNFWGKTEVRKRLWSGVRLNEQPLQYTGTGKELFLGFLLVFLIVIFPILLTTVAAAFAFGPESTGYSLYTLVLYGVIFFLFGMAIYRAMRYRLSRTRWRSIRAALTGSDKGYAKTYFWTGLLIPLTLGWIVPWRNTKLQDIMTNDMSFGTTPFRFSAKSGPLYLPFATLWVGALVIIALVGWAFMDIFGHELSLNPGLDSDEQTVRLPPTAIAMIFAVTVLGYLLYGVVSAWYHARQFNHFSDHTHLDQATFSGTMSGPGLMWVTVSNIVIIIVTLGLLTPIALARATRYMVDHLAITGHIDFDAIQQSADTGPERGEGLAQAFDIDGF